MNKAFLCLSAVLLLANLSAEEKFQVRLTGKTDYKISPVWKAKKLHGKDFYLSLPIAHYNPPAAPEKRKKYDAQRPNSLHYPLSKLPPGMKKYMDIPAFREALYESTYITPAQVITNPDGSVTFDLDKINALFKEDKLHVLKLSRFVRQYARCYRDYFYFKTYKHDMEKYNAWKKRQKYLFSINALGEWGNESNIFARRMEAYIKANKIPAETAAKMREQWPDKFTGRRDYIEKRLKRYYDRNVETWFNDAGMLEALEGYWCINHLAAYWGNVKRIVIETSRPFVNWQQQMMFNRGAARQFDRYWGWYSASYYTGYDSKGKWMVDAEPAAWRRGKNWAPGYGLSQNIIKRVYRVAWITGANFFEREDTASNFWDSTRKGPDRWKPAPEGQIFIDFADFSRNNPDRGTTYTPVALLVPYDQGAARDLIRPFNRFAYLKGDHMFNAFMATILPQIPRRLAEKKGIEHSLKNTPYGDIFDILTPDFPDSSALRKTLGAYKAAVLIGKYDTHPEMSKALREYVRNGGTLIINAKQLNLFDSKFTGVESLNSTFKKDSYVIEKLRLAGAVSASVDDSGAPIFTVHKFGKGRVVVGTPHYLVPDYDDKNPKAQQIALAQVKSGAKYKYIQQLLGQLADELLPISVKGDIQYGINKTDKGWLVYLFNNKGITKFADTPESFDAGKTAEVVIRLKGVKAETFHELGSDKKEKLKNNTLSVKVAPGAWKFLVFE